MFLGGRIDMCVTLVRPTCGKPHVWEARDVALAQTPRAALHIVSYDSRFIKKHWIFTRKCVRVFLFCWSIVNAVGCIVLYTGVNTIVTWYLGVFYTRYYSKEPVVPVV